MFKNRLKNTHYFGMPLGVKMEPKLVKHGCPSKGMLVWVWPLKHEKIRHFCNLIAKLLEKTRVFDVPGPPGPLQTSKEPSGPQFDLPPGP